MDGIYGHGVISATMASGASLSTAIYVLGANKLLLELPTFSIGLNASTCNVYVQGCSTNTGGTFRRVQVMGAYSAGSGIRDWETLAGVGNSLVVFDPTPVPKWIKLEVNSVATAAGYAANVHVLF